MELALNNITFKILYGRTFDKDQEQIKLLPKYKRALLTFCYCNFAKTFYPLFGFLLPFLPTFHRATKVLEQMDEIIRREILEHQQKLDDNKPPSFMDLFLFQMRKPAMEEDYNMATLTGNVNTLLIAASDSTISTFVWFLLLMADNPNVQDQVQREMDFLWGLDTELKYADKSLLPILQAAILETLRFRYIIHLYVPRRTSKDTTLRGHDIPKDTLVFVNPNPLMCSNEYWRNPDNFDPTRFLSEDRQTVVIPEHFIPFSYGKRKCPGEKIALNTLFMFGANILHKFKILPPEGGVNLDVQTLITNSAVHPLVRFQRRW